MSRQVASSLAISRCGVRSPAYGETEQMLRVSLVCREAREDQEGSVYSVSLETNNNLDLGI